MRRPFRLSLLPLLLCAWPCFAQNQNYLPLSRAETDRRFPVKFIGETGGGRPGHFGTAADGTPAPAKVSVGPSGASFEMDEEGRAVIKGKDRSGAPWRVRLGNLTTLAGANLYTADLDRDNVQDLVVVSPMGGNGLAPTRHLFTLTFDGKGRPVPFEADG